MKGGMSLEALLSVRGLKVNFYTYRGVVKALDGVSFDMYRGETFGLVGESGCGKTVTSLAITRLIPEPGRIVGGKIFFEGEDLLKKTEEEMRRIRGKRIAMIFQDPVTSLNPVYTVGDQVAEVIKLHQIKEKAKVKDKVVQMFKLVGIQPASERIMDYPHEFSGGMQQRVMIAMALSCQPTLLIADEPTSSLDVTIQAQILKLMRELKKKIDASILLITHDFGIVAEMCDRCAVMYCGNVVEIGDVRAIFYEPKHPYTKGLVNAIPSISQKRERLEEIPGVVPNLIDPPSGCRFHPRCKFSSEICKREKPQLTEIEKNHLVACHLFSN